MPFNAIDDEGNFLSCPECGSSHLNRQGYKTLRSGEAKQRWKCVACSYKTVSPIRNSKDTIVENVRLSKQKQSYQDRSRIERKSFREYARLENAVTQLNAKLIKVLEKQQLTPLKKDKKENPKCVGVLVERAKTFFSTYKVSNVLIAFTGDLLNSDRRLDEYLTNAGNRSGALFSAVDLYQQLIMDMQKDFNLSVLSVSGNESRVKEEYGWVDVVATDNYDHTIANMLRYLFRERRIAFIDGDPMEKIVDLAGQKVLFLHGHGRIKANHETSVNQIKGVYSSRGVKIDYVVSGHVHSARVGDTFARSASLVGANDYSEKALNLEGRASQNCFVFHQNGNRDGIKIDLNNVDDVTNGYEVPEETKQYHSKSYEKLREPTTILKIQV
jgi:predicted phosphodiesterase